MKNPFAKQPSKEEKVERNAFDLSRQNLFTADFGQLLPVFVQEVLPGDSFKLRPKCVVQGMPTQFPVQTRMNGYIHYFYVRNRTLWKNWEDFIFKTKDDLVQPWIHVNNGFKAGIYFKTGSLADYLGVPTSYVNAVASDSSVTKLNFNKRPIDSAYGCVFPYETSNLTAFDGSRYVGRPSSYVDIFSLGNRDVASNGFWGYMLSGFTSDIDDSISFVAKTDLSDGSISPVGGKVFVGFFTRFSDGSSDSYVCQGFSQCTVTVDSLTAKVMSINSAFVDSFNRFGRQIGFDNLYVALFVAPTGTVTGKISVSGSFPAVSSPIQSADDIFTSFGSVSAYSVVDASSDSNVYTNSPYYGDNPSLRINALPFRAYTMVANYFYRNDLNNPYVIDGEVQYNQFIPTLDGGADDNLYTLHRRNWELDRFTSAVQSPQFGVAPLVGLTVNGDTATFTFNSGGSVTSDPSANYTATVPIDEDGHILGIGDYSKDIPSGNLRQIMDLHTAGISINDIRNANHYLRFLENTQKRGLRYRSQMQSHMGINLDFPDIDVPQFIGGCSGRLGVDKVTAFASTSSAGLGDFNGIIGGVIDSQHDIHCYCPEHGYIIGIFSLSPVPTYPQTPASYLHKTSPFDYFQKEFKHTAYVLITMSEILPLQCSDVNTVFGYQRAFYDYISAIDEVHGDFRDSLKDFVLTRIFADEPTLSADFTTISSEQLNDIWTVNNIASDKGSVAHFLCQVFHAVIAKRQIPKWGNPSLE